MNKVDELLLKEVIDESIEKANAYNIRKNGKSIERKISPYINIIPKKNKNGLDIYVKENTKFGIIHIPVIISESGLKDTVYNDFHIGKNSNIIILAGCGIHNDKHEDSQHDGIHRFFLEENSQVKYVEKHYGSGKGEKIINPVTEIHLKNDAKMTMDSTQIKGVSETIRVTKAILEKNATLIINEKILTTDKEKAKTEFEIELNGENSSIQVTSRSVATDKSYQEFYSNVVGNNKCYAHISCDAIIKHEGKVLAIPQIFAKNVEANLIHEATIGKIAGEQLLKLMTLGLSEKEAEEIIIKGFLK